MESALKVTMGMSLVVAAGLVAVGMVCRSQASGVADVNGAGAGARQGAAANSPLRTPGQLQIDILQQRRQMMLGNIQNAQRDGDIAEQEIRSAQANISRVETAFHLLVVESTHPGMTEREREALAAQMKQNVRVDQPEAAGKLKSAETSKDQAATRLVNVQHDLDALDDQIALLTGGIRVP